MDFKKAALNACELLERWTGDTVVPYSEFREVHNRAVLFNAEIVRGNLVVLTREDHEALLKNQKPQRKKRG